MNIFKSFIFAILTLFATTATASQYYISICAIFQNEADYLKEWIEYHRIIGVEHFYLYNNESDDNYLKVLSPYISEGIVELKDWPKTPQEGIDHVPAQRRAYNDCIRLASGVTDWLAIIDIDEFIVPVDRPDLVAFLADYETDPKIAGIKINWQLFGTSNLKTLPTDRPMIESLILKAPWNYKTSLKNPPHNGVVKTIVRPHTVERYHTHGGVYKRGFYTVPDNRRGQYMDPVEINRIRINHYWTRAEDWFYETKFLRRRFVIKDHLAELSYLKQKFDDLNQVKDTVIFKYLPQLRERLGYDN